MSKFYNDVELKEIGLFLKNLLEVKNSEIENKKLNDLIFKFGYDNEGFYSFRGYTESNFINTFFDNKVNYDIDAEIPLDKSFVRFYFKGGATKEINF
jgi:hypothetical protein